MGGIYYIPPSSLPASTSLAIGSAITGGTANRVLYENVANLLAESTNLKFDGTTLEGKLLQLFYDKAGFPTSYLEYDGNFYIRFAANAKFSVTNTETYCEAIYSLLIYCNNLSTRGANDAFTMTVNNAGVLTTAYVIRGTGRFEMLNLALATTGGSKRCGNATLIGGTVTVNTTAATATSEIFLQLITIGGTPGLVTITKVAGTSFTLTSLNVLDTSTYSFLIVETY